MSSSSPAADGASAGPSRSASAAPGANTPLPPGHPQSRPSQTMKVAILGGGPSGAFAAAQLASAGVDTVVFDEKLAWEKPCGGGLTYKAYSQYPFLAENDTPKKIVRKTVLAAPKSQPVTLSLDHPLLIYSRYDLNGMLLDRAQHAGRATGENARSEHRAIGRGWSLRTKNGAMDADYCIVATGARNPLRDFGTELDVRVTP